MTPWSKFYNAYKALVQLGFQPVALNALYRFGLSSGHYRRAENREQKIENGVLHPLFTFPAPEELLPVLGEDG